MMQPLIWFILTYAVYWTVKRFYKRYPKIYLTPLLIAPILLILLIVYSGVPFASYEKGAGLLSDMIEPATIALAVILYKHYDVLRRNAKAIAASAGTGAIAAILTSAGLARLFGLTPSVTDSLAPRSATTPIALPISDMIGGIPTITAVATLITGLLGTILGPLIVRWFHIRSPIGRGALFGTSAHAAGISKAFEYDAMAGSVAAIAMMFTAFVTLWATPWLIVWFQ